MIQIIPVGPFVDHPGQEPRNFTCTSSGIRRSLVGEAVVHHFKDGLTKNIALPQLIRCSHGYCSDRLFTRSWDCFSSPTMGG